MLLAVLLWCSLAQELLDQPPNIFDLAPESIVQCRCPAAPPCDVSLTVVAPEIAKLRLECPSTWDPCEPLQSALLARLPLLCVTEGACKAELERHRWWLASRSAIDEYNRLSSVVWDLRAKIKRCDSVRICISRLQKQLGKLEMRREQLPEALPHLEKRLKRRLGMLEECQGDWAQCSDIISGVRSARRKVAIAYNVTLTYLENVACETSSCKRALNASVVELRNAARHNQRALANIPQTKMSLAHGIPVVIFYGLCCLAVVMIFDVGFWRGTLTSQKKNIAVLVAIACSAVLQVSVFSLLMTGVGVGTSSETWWTLRAINDRLQLIVCCIAVLLVLSSWVHVSLGEVLGKQGLARKISLSCLAAVLIVGVFGLVVLSLRIAAGALPGSALQQFMWSNDYSNRIVVILLLCSCMCVIACHVVVWRVMVQSKDSARIFALTKVSICAASTTLGAFIKVFVIYYSRYGYYVMPSWVSPFFGYIIADAFIYGGILSLVLFQFVRVTRPPQKAQEDTNKEMEIPLLKDMDQGFERTPARYLI
jgi:hypothetical protein